MEQEDLTYLNEFEHSLRQELLRYCTEKKLLNGQLYQVEELDEKWHIEMPYYCADAVPEIAKYPHSSIVWAAYVGMGYAAVWDDSWNTKKDINLYQMIRDTKDYDHIDEAVVETIIGLDPKGEEVRLLTEVMIACANTALTRIHKEEIEPQSKMAFYVYARCITVFFSLGVALELKRRGYLYQKMKISDLN